jgi:hypothetical protein
MSTDRELLEAAAKAAGITIYKSGQAERDESGHGDVGLWVHGSTCWNPLRDDGDALRLAVKLRLAITPIPGNGRDGPLTNVCRIEGEVITDVFEDGYSAAVWRRAIVRAAAAIGEAA